MVEPFAIEQCYGDDKVWTTCARRLNPAEECRAQPSSGRWIPRSCSLRASPVHVFSATRPLRLLTPGTCTWLEAMLRCHCTQKVPDTQETGHITTLATVQNSRNHLACSTNSIYSLGRYALNYNLALVLHRLVSCHKSQLTSLVSVNKITVRWMGRTEAQ